MTADLLKRLESGSGADRELDGEIMFSLFAKPVGENGYLWPEDNPSWSFAMRFPGKDASWFKKHRGSQETIIIWRDGDPILMNSLRVPKLTTSLDAALSITERKLPDAHYRIEKGMSFLWLAVNDGVDVHEGIGKPPRALCAALLRALEDHP